MVTSTTPTRATRLIAASQLKAGMTYIDRGAEVTVADVQPEDRLTWLMADAEPRCVTVTDSEGYKRRIPTGNTLRVITEEVTA